MKNYDVRIDTPSQQPAADRSRDSAPAQCATRQYGVSQSPRMQSQRHAIQMASHEALQRRSGDERAATNATGMPDPLKAGIESLSGMDLSGVRVHRNSPRPAQLHAHAYAQGNQIHLAPGQEAHLPHEAWHVVQQRQGRVRPTMHVGGVKVNDNAGLEKEADSMGDRAVSQGAHMDVAAITQCASSTTSASTTSDDAAPVQRSGKGALAGAAIGGGLGAFGFFAGPIVGAITTTVGALIGGIVGHLKTDGPLPRGAFARGDKTLAPVSTTELNSIIDGSTHTPEELREQLRATGAKLIEQGLLFWTAGVQEHCEVIVDNEKSGSYRVRVIVVIPRRPTRDQQDVDLQRGAAVHELVHALEVVSQIGGLDNLGKDIPKVKESDNVLRGNQLQWSKLPAEQTKAMAQTLKRQLNDVIGEEVERGVPKNKIKFAWSYYEPRLDYAITNRHEVPTVIVQLVEDIHAFGDQDMLGDTPFYRTLIESRRLIMQAL